MYMYKIYDAENVCTDITVVAHYPGQLNVFFVEFDTVFFLCEITEFS